MSRSYPAKILLFGEQTLLRGGRGLAVPYHRLSLRWQQGEPDERLLKFAAYLSQELPSGALHAGAMDAFLQAGGHLAGDIPTGYGLGSSGAVCAAVWDRFATDRGRALSGENLRQNFARMEAFFHGSSSGTDPLICYLDQPMLLGGGDPPAPVNLPPDWNTGFFLLDTGVARSAATFIDRFTSRYDSEPAFTTGTNTHWRDAANAASDALLNDNRPALHQAFRRISAFQLRELPDFIPASLHTRWFGEDYILKICGAGGGGMLLGLAQDREAVARVLGDVWWL